MPPAPGIIPSRVSGRPMVALDERTRKCVERASSRPPPRARDEIADMVGIWRLERDAKVPRRLLRNWAVLDGTSERWSA